MLTEYLSDWFNPNTPKEYWNKEFDLFYNAKTGVDIDGVWIDMNEPASVSAIISSIETCMISHTLSSVRTLVTIPLNKLGNKPSLLLAQMLPLTLTHPSSTKLLI